MVGLLADRRLRSRAGRRAANQRPTGDAARASRRSSNGQGDGKAATNRRRTANQRPSGRISRTGQSPSVWVMPTDEESVVASGSLSAVRAARSREPRPMILSKTSG